MVNFILHNYCYSCYISIHYIVIVFHACKTPPPSIHVLVVHFFLIKLILYKIYLNPLKSNHYYQNKEKTLLVKEKNIYIKEIEHINKCLEKLSSNKTQNFELDESQVTVTCNFTQKNRQKNNNDCKQCIWHYIGNK